MPNLGIIASSISGHLTPPYTEIGDYDALAALTVPSGGIASINFNGLPSGYKHLQIRATVKTNRSDNQDVVRIRYNGDTSASYSYHLLTSTGAAAGGDAGTSTASPWCAIIAGNLDAANMYGVMIADLVDYSSETKYKTLRALSGSDQNNSAGRLYFASTLWRSLAPVTSIQITPLYGSLFSEFTSFALYGVK